MFTEIGPQGEDEGSLEVAAMDAVAQVDVAEEAGRQAEPVPGAIDRDHAVPDAEVAGDDVDDRRRCRRGS